jgi:hypothetical protein
MVKKIAPKNDSMLNAADQAASVGQLSSSIVPRSVEHRIITLKSARASTGVVGVAGNTGYYGYQITGEYLRSLDGSAGRMVFEEMR